MLFMIKCAIAHYKINREYNLGKHTVIKVKNRNKNKFDFFLINLDS